MDSLSIILDSNASRRDGLSGHDLYWDEARLILKKEVEDHKLGLCDCEQSPEENTKLVCRAGMWLNGKYPSKFVVQDYHFENRKRK